MSIILRYSWNTLEAANGRREDLAFHSANAARSPRGSRTRTKIFASVAPICPTRFPAVPDVSEPRARLCHVTARRWIQRFEQRESRGPNHRRKLFFSSSMSIACVDREMLAGDTPEILQMGATTDFRTDVRRQCPDVSSARTGNFDIRSRDRFGVRQSASIRIERGSRGISFPWRAKLIQTHAVFLERREHRRHL